MSYETNYLKYRGKCKEMSEALCRENQSLRLVRGHYYEPYWNREEPHWRCEDSAGNIIDPTKLQFPSGGIPEFYTEFDGTVECSNCGKQMKEDEAHYDSNYCFCSYLCHGQFVGVL